MQKFTKIFRFTYSIIEILHYASRYIVLIFDKISNLTIFFLIIKKLLTLDQDNERWTFCLRKRSFNY